MSAFTHWHLYKRPGRRDWQQSLATKTVTGGREPDESSSESGSAVLTITREIWNAGADHVDRIESMTLTISPDELKAIGLEWSK